MAGSLFLFISVVAFIASRQQWESILVLAWLCFESMVVFNALCMPTKGVKNVLLFVTKLSSYLLVVLLSISPGIFYVGFQY